VCWLSLGLSKSNKFQRPVRQCCSQHLPYLPYVSVARSSQDAHSSHPNHQELAHNSEPSNPHAGSSWPHNRVSSFLSCASPLSSVFFSAFTRYLAGVSCGFRWQNGSRVYEGVSLPFFFFLLLCFVFLSDRLTSYQKRPLNSTHTTFHSLQSADGTRDCHTCRAGRPAQLKLYLTST
jgi:hypothetical protein